MDACAGGSGDSHANYGCIESRRDARRACTSPDLPADAEALRLLVLTIMAERDAVVAERDSVVADRDRLQADNDVLLARAERLEHLLRTLRRLQFGRKSERLPEEQLQLGLEDTEAAIAKVEAEAERLDPALRRGRTATRRANRGKLPAHLPRIKIPSIKSYH